MRKLTKLFLACAVLTSLAIAAMGIEPFALEDLHLIHWEDVPNGRPSYTGPVSAAILMAWYAEHGYPELLPDLNHDGQINEEDTLLLARDFGEEMGGQMIADQLADPFIVYPLARYIGERYPNEFRMLIYDESFPEEVEHDLGQPFIPTEVGGIVLEVHEDPFYELYVHHLEAQRPGIVGIGPDFPDWNHFAVSRSFIPQEEPEGFPVDLVSTSHRVFTEEPVWNTFLRIEYERWGFLTPEWVPFEILIVLIPAHEADGMPGQPSDNPGDDPGDDPGGDPGDDPGGDPGGGDQPRYPGQPGGEPGDDPGGDPRFPPNSDDSGVCCLPDGSCDSTISADYCERLGGTFTIGDTCATVECPQSDGDPCAAVEGEITDICYTYENGVLSVYVSYEVHNRGTVMANDITIYGLVGLNDGVNGLGGGQECQDWQYGVDIAAGSTYSFDRTYSTSAPNLDLNNLTYLYGSLWLQVEAPWDCWPIINQQFVQTWDPAPLCNPQSGGTPPGGSSDGQPTGSVADVQISMQLVSPASDPVAPGSQAQYNLNVWQAGPATAENVVVELTLPSSVTVSGSSGSAIQTAHRPPNDVLRWDLGDLATFPPGTSIWLQVDVDQDACGTVLYGFSVTSDTTDPDLSNNTGTLATLIDPCGGEPGTPPGGEGEPSGACCLPSGQCIETGITNCDSQGGEFRGEGSACEGSDCPSGSSEGDCPYISAYVDEVCYDYPGPNESLLVRATFTIDNFGTAVAQTPWFEAEATYEITEGVTTTTYKDTYTGYTPDIPAGGSTSVTHEFNLGLVPQEPTDGVMVHVLSRINSPCKDYTETTGTNHSTLRCPSEDDGTGEPGEPVPEPDPQPDPEPDPQPTLLPNLWVTGMTGCWTWSSGGDEHVIATVTGIVHNGGQADAANVRAEVSAGGKSTVITVGTISAGGQKMVSATIDVGAYDQVSWPVSTSIEADPYHAITEADETNNTTSSSFPESSGCN
jgi:hypothetical protein